MRGHGFNLFQMYKVWVRNSNEIIKLNLNNSNRPRSKIIDLRRSEVCFWVTVFPSIGPRRSRVGSSISNACLNPGGPVTCYGLHVAAAASLSLLRYAMVPFRRRDNKSSYWYLKQIPSHNRCCAFFLHQLQPATNHSMGNSRKRLIVSVWQA